LGKQGSFIREPPFLALLILSLLILSLLAKELKEKGRFFVLLKEKQKKILIVFLQALLRRSSFSFVGKEKGCLELFLSSRYEKNKEGAFFFFIFTSHE